MPIAQALHFGEPAVPARRRVRRRAQIGNLGRNGFEPRLENARQAQQHGVALIGRRIAAIAEHDDAGQAFAHQADELLVHAHRDLGAARKKERHIARKLQRIAKTLFGLDVNVLAGEIFALPGDFRKFRALALGRAQTPFVFVPAFGEIAAHKKENAEAGPRIGVMRRQRDGAAQCRNAFFEAAAVMQRGAEIGPAVGIIGIDLDGAAVSGDRLVEAPQGVQRIAEIAVRLGKIRLGRDRLALGARRAFVVLQFIERDAEIAERGGHFGIDLERGTRGVGGELGAAGEAEHFAEIGMEQRHLRRELGCALHVLDGVAELAVLVGDDAEQMLGFRHVRLRLEDLAADRLRLHQLAFGAAALGVHQRLAERHEMSGWLGLAPCIVSITTRPAGVANEKPVSHFTFGRKQARMRWDRNVSGRSLKSRITA